MHHSVAVMYGGVILFSSGGESSNGGPLSLFDEENIMSQASRSFVSPCCSAHAGIFISICFSLFFCRRMLSGVQMGAVQ